MFETPDLRGTHSAAALVQRARQKYVGRSDAAWLYAHTFGIQSVLTVRSHADRGRIRERACHHPRYTHLPPRGALVRQSCMRAHVWACVAGAIASTTARAAIRHILPAMFVGVWSLLTQFWVERGGRMRERAPGVADQGRAPPPAWHSACGADFACTNAAVHCRCITPISF